MSLTESRQFTPESSGKKAVIDFLLQSSKEYEPELYDQVCKQLTAELKNIKSEKERQDLLNSRFVDFAQWYLEKEKNHAETSQTKLYQNYGMRPIQLSLEYLKGQKLIEKGRNNEAYTDNTRNNFTESAAFQYGPSTMYNLKSGEWLEIKQFGEQDVAGSFAFSACTALVIRGKGKTIFAHSTTPQEIAGLAAHLSSKLDGQVNITMVSPKFYPIAGSQESADQAEKFTNSRSLISDKLRSTLASKINKFTEGYYPYVSTDAQRDKRTFESAVLVGKDFVSTVGYNFLPEDGKQKENVIRFPFFIDTLQQVEGK